jgi:hypothetical protein
MKNRFEINIEILEYMQKVFLKYPELRFSQVLSICNIEGDRDFYEEPDITLQKLKLSFPNI